MGRVLSSEVTLEPAQEFELTDQDFKYVQWFIHKHVGIFLSDHKRAMVYGRLSRKLREKGLKRFADYRECIENNQDDRMAFINALTTNKRIFSVRSTRRVSRKPVVSLLARSTQKESQNLVCWVLNW